MRPLRVLLVLLVLLALVLVVADRVGVWVAQRAVADQVAAELADQGIQTADPEVSIAGVPFLTQVAAGRYQSVTVLLREVGVAGVRLPQVELEATGVTASVDTLVSGEGPIDAERVQGEATIGYASVAALPELDGIELSPAANGQLRVQAPAEVLGNQLTLTGTGDLGVSDGAVTVQVSSLTVAEPDELPPGGEPVLEEVAQQLSVALPLPPLPYGLAVESVRADAAGLVIGMSARDVPLAR